MKIGDIAKEAVDHDGEMIYNGDVKAEIVFSKDLCERARSDNLGHEVSGLFGSRTLL